MGGGGAKEKKEEEKGVPRLFLGSYLGLGAVLKEGAGEKEVNPPALSNLGNGPVSYNVKWREI